MYPDGGIGVLFNYGSPMLFGGKPMASPFILDGTSTIATSVEFRGEIDALGIRFKPGGAVPFIQHPLHELKNQHETFEALEMKELLQVGNTLPESVSFRERIRMIESALSGLLAQATKMPSGHFFSTIPKQINSRSTVSSLAKSVGIGCRQLERLFKKHAGMTPGEYLKVQRVETAREYLKNRIQQTCTQIGFDSGYYDQSHFIREFRSVTGMTPKSYRNRKRESNP